MFSIGVGTTLYTNVTKNQVVEQVETTGYREPGFLLSVIGISTHSILKTA